jgi:hypothetical protein
LTVRCFRNDLARTTVSGTRARLVPLATMI